MASTATRSKRKTKARNAAKSKAPPRRVSNVKLLKLAAKHRPPQNWYDQTDLPFTPRPD